MILSARFIKKSKLRRRCDDCKRPLTGPHIRLYGAGDPGDKPYTLRLHVTCANTPTATEPKLVEALEKARAI